MAFLTFYFILDLDDINDIPAFTSKLGDAFLELMIKEGVFELLCRRANNRRK